MNLDGRGSSVVASPREQYRLRPKSAGHAMKKTVDISTEDDYCYDDDEFYDDNSPTLRSPRASPPGLSCTPRLSWMEDQQYHDMIDMSTQTVVHSGQYMSVTGAACCW